VQGTCAQGNIYQAFGDVATDFELSRFNRDTSRDAALRRRYDQRMATSRLALAVFAASLSVVSGCAVPIVGAMEDREATQVVVALEHGGIAGAKEEDPTVEGKFRVSVAKDDAAEALSILREEELPRAHPKGVLESMGQGSLVPSQLSEHAAHVIGLAGEIERTLLNVDGVLQARVHLNMPAAEPFRTGPLPKATASVLIEHRGTAPPVTQEALQRLVAGGLPNLAPGDVTVVLVTRPSRALPSGDRLSTVGPFAVSRSSKRMLQGALLGGVLLVLALTLTCLILYTRMARLREKEV
jgi:type III secretion protein J